MRTDPSRMLRSKIATLKARRRSWAKDTRPHPKGLYIVCINIQHLGLYSGGCYNAHQILHPSAKAQTSKLQLDKLRGSPALPNHNDIPQPQRGNVAKNATVIQGLLCDQAVIASLIRGKDTYGFSKRRPSDACVAANLKKIRIISD